MATTQLESGSFMVGMNRDCKSASMNKPLCAHMWNALPSPQKEKKKKTYTTSSPLGIETVRMMLFSFDTSVNSDSDQLSGNKATVDLLRFFLLSQISLLCQSLEADTPLWRRCTTSDALYANQALRRQIWVAQLVSI